MGMIIAGLISRFKLRPETVRLIAHLGLVVLVLGLLAAIYFWVRSDAIADHQRAVETRARPATDKASTERAADAIRNEREHQETRNEIAVQPDHVPAPSTLTLSCIRLRNAGIVSPACPRPAGSDRAEALTHR